jgi:hypothetical protein
LEDYEVNIRGMERFGARKEAPLETCISEVEQCEIFIGIIAFKLGSIDKSSGKSFTQREYETAYKLNQEILIYMMDEKYSKVPPVYIDHGEKWEKLMAFKSVLKDNHTFDSFTSEDDLEQKIRRKFDELLAAKTEEKEVDEYNQSKKIIHKFLLLPKLYSGHEIKLQVELGEPFPASKSLCSNFNLEFGKTIGVKAEIKKPDITDNPFEYIFIDGEDNLHDYFSLQKNNIEIYGKLQFSGDVFDNVRANFVRKEFSYLGSYMITTFPRNWGQVKKTVVEPDGRIIIKLTKILK